MDMADSSQVPISEDTPEEEARRLAQHDLADIQRFFNNFHAQDTQDIIKALRERADFLERGDKASRFFRQSKSSLK
jgi:hypothetical protein